MSKEVIKKMVFSSEYKQNGSECTGGFIQPDVMVSFDLNPFGCLYYMAYVEFSYKKNKLDRNETTFNGNSLWGLGRKKKDELIEIINSYKNIDQIRKDFMC